MNSKKNRSGKGNFGLREPRSRFYDTIKKGETTMSKINALYILIVVVVAVAIFLGVAATNKSSSNSHSQVVQQSDECCPAETSQTASKVKAWNEICPVMGGTVQEASRTVEYNEKFYGFCCPGCIDQFAENPEKFAANLSEDGKEYIQ